MHLLELIDQRRGCLQRLFRVNASVDGERAGIEIVTGIAMDVVTEGALLTQLHEQPATHAFSEHDADEVQGEAVGILVGESRHRHFYVGLLRPLVHDRDLG